MKVTIARSVFARELQLMHDVIDRKATIPILAFMLVEATADRVSLFATNLMVGLRTSLEAEVTRPGTAVLPIALLHSLVGSFSDGPIVLDVVKDHVTVTSGQSVTKFPLLLVEDFPLVPESGPVMATIAVGALRTVIQQVRHAVGASKLNYWLDGAMVTIADGCLMGVASDGYRISKATRPLTGDFHAIDMLVPSKALGSLDKILGLAVQDALVQIGGTDRVSSWTVGPRVLVARLADGQFLQYQRMIPPQSSAMVRLDREPFLQALRRLMVVVTPNKRKVTLQITRGHVTCVSETTVGAFSEPILADYDGDDLQIAFDPGYVLDALEALDVEGIRIGLTNASSSAIFRPVDDEDRLCVICPKRI